MENQEIDETQSEAAETTDNAFEEIGDEFAFLHSDNDNFSFSKAFKAYHDDQDYEEAIAKFQAAIEYEKTYNDSQEDNSFQDEWSAEDSDEVIAKSMYWMGESYLKIQQVDQAIGVFEELADNYSGHYLGLAAQRRANRLKTD